MLAVLHTLWMFVVDLFKPRWRLQAEKLFLRHQLGIAVRRAPPRFCLHNSDRALLLWMTRLWPNLLGLARVVQPDTKSKTRAMPAHYGLRSYDGERVASARKQTADPAKY